MFTPCRRKSTSLIEQLLVAPQEFSFLQVVRLVERSLIYTTRRSDVSRSPSSYGLVGEFTHPTRETLAFFTKPSLAFPESEVSRLELSRKRGSGAIHAQIDFIGLLGAMGVMPFHYTEFLLQRQKQKDETLAHFLDLFNHRIASLFYRAQTKYSLPLSLERSQLAEGVAQDCVLPTQVLLSLVGLGTEKLKNQLELSDSSLIYYSGHFIGQTRTAFGLQSILADYFNLRVQIQQFVGHWQDLIPDIRTRTGSHSNRKGQNACLGRSAMLGSRAWIAQGKIRIVIEPLDKKQLEIFAPGTKTFDVMNQLVKMYLGLEQDYEFIMEIKRIDLPKRMQIKSKRPPVLGWNSWMMGAHSASNTDETIKIRVSAKPN